VPSPSERGKPAFRTFANENVSGSFCLRLREFFVRGFAKRIDGGYFARRFVTEAAKGKFRLKVFLDVRVLDNSRSERIITRKEGIPVNVAARPEGIAARVKKMRPQLVNFFRSSVHV
jgi:hypothetical protein